jgi:hypothetical protein
MNSSTKFALVRHADRGFVPGLAKLYGIDQGSPDFDRLIEDLNDYCRSVAPVPVSLRDPSEIKPLLDVFREQRQRPTNFFVIFIEGLLFKNIVNGQIKTTHSYNECAAFSDAMVAHNVISKLKAMGAFPIRITSITNQIRKPETISSQLTGLGFDS